jgi:small subunit ribosomal protein S18
MIQKKRKIKVAKNCPFCKEKTEPNFKDVATLSHYLTDRGRIIGRDRSGICAKHQRKITREVKRARHIAILPFVSGL